MSTPRFRCFALLLALGLGAQVSAEEMKRVQLNGFSLLLPAGTVVAESTLPFAGRHELRLEASGKRTSNPRVVVRWSFHGLANEEYRQLLVDGLSKTLPGDARVIREAGSLDKGWAAIMGGQGSTLGLGLFGCERGFGIELVVSVSKDREEQFALTRDVISSVRCSLTDANRQRPVAATQLPKEFLTIPDQEFASYATLEGEVMNVNFTGGDITRNRELAKKVIHGMFSGGLQIAKDDIVFVPLADVITLRHRTVLWKVSFPETPYLYMGMLWCPKLDVTFMPLYIAEDATEKRVREIIGSIGCPGDPHRAPPDARAPFEAACAKGNEFACGLRKEYSF